MNTPYAITPSDTRAVPRGTAERESADIARARAQDLDELEDDPAVGAWICMGWLAFLVIVIAATGAWPFIRAWWLSL